MTTLSLLGCLLEKHGWTEALALDAVVSVLPGRASTEALRRNGWPPSLGSHASWPDGFALLGRRLGAAEGVPLRSPHVSGKPTAPCLSQPLRALAGRASYMVSIHVIDHSVRC